MKQSLNRKCVKSISCRDGAEWINMNLLNSNKKAYSMPCCAVYAKDAYSVEAIPDSDIIGIGVIRGNIFTSYGKDFAEEKLLQLYSDVINGLCKKGWKCCIFTNGYSGDIQFAHNLYKRVGKKEVIMKEAPKDASELITTISQFKGMITARLHSCIVAYSLQIPTVAITWTNKVKDFMNLIAKPDSAIELDELTTEKILQRFETALSEKYDLSIYEEVREQVLKEIENIKNDIEKGK